MTNEIIELARDGDAYRDYCLWDYEPVAPTAGKLRSSTLLWQSFAAASAPARLRRIVEALRRALGPFNTVWGVKQAGGRLTWELYFYDYERLQRTVSIERVLAVIEPWLETSLRLSPGRPYFMFSIDLDPAPVEGDIGGHVEGRARLDEISVYLGNPGSAVSSGLCYSLTHSGLRLDNLYNFFDARAERDDILAKVAASLHLDLAGFEPDLVLMPQLVDCGVVVVANKKACDGVYFSRIRIDQLIWFCRRFDWPRPIAGFLEAHRDRLDHMLYDVGIDYTMIDGRIEITKTAFYGVV